uniref:Uncharacterized protein n=1 Tax=Meloidogyne hapla TaxID=6305 RepID=A0A1I8B5M6_MELHA
MDLEIENSGTVNTNFNNRNERGLMFYRRLYRVGQNIQAEMELKKFYPKCNFLALDPVSEVNAELVEQKLNGTFVERVITAEDEYTANIRGHIWNTQG